MSDSLSEVVSSFKFFFHPWIVEKRLSLLCRKKEEELLYFHASMASKCAREKRKMNKKKGRETMEQRRQNCTAKNKESNYVHFFRSFSLERRKEKMFLARVIKLEKKVSSRPIHVTKNVLGKKIS